MGVFKKLVVGGVVISLAAFGASRGLSMIRNNGKKEVYVVKVSGIEETYYADDTVMTGNITTNISQNISFDRDVIVLDMPVSKGDTVQKGDVLLTFDMTLPEMELNIARLKKQLQQQNLAKAQNRLYSLQNGGSILETDGDGFGADNLSAITNSSADASGAGDVFRYENTDGRIQNMYLAASFLPLLASDLLTGGDPGEAYEDGDYDGGEFTEGYDGEDVVYGDDVGGSASAGGLLDPTTAGGIQNVINQGTTSGGELLASEPNRYQSTSDISGSLIGLTESQDALSGGVEGEAQDIPLYITPTPGGVTPTPKLIDPQGAVSLTDGEAPFYQILTYQTEPYQGRGTKEDPFVFLCSNARGAVTLTGSFLNRMAGFSEDGGMLLHEGGYWYLLEFHYNDTIKDLLDRRGSCMGYYLLDGSMLEKPVNPFAQMSLKEEEADRYADPDHDDGEEDDMDIDLPSDDDAVSLSRNDAIRIQQKTIETLKISIRESDIKIAKLEQKIAQKEIVARIDGTVAYAGDPVTGNYSGDAFLKVKSKEGFFVRGTVSELMLDSMKVGTKLKCNSYTIGSFDAEVLEVSDYPVGASDAYYGYGMQNPNASNYLYTARIENQSLALSDMDYVQVSPVREKDKSDGIVLERAFVLTENGNNYVYKAENGVLKKSMVRVSGIVNMGYSVMITGGLSREDWIAFPYGDAADGVTAKEGTLSELYGW